ncbi:hypothetical protein KCP71_15670 [Salmonella enterica subsp. enterica]|nr:hypothetical protein KCP71_15670 [Salmonella enterica subsp. enterica]
MASVNQFLTFGGGEWRHDKLSDAVNLTGGSSTKPPHRQPAVRSFRLKMVAHLRSRWR